MYKILFLPEARYLTKYDSFYPEHLDNDSIVRKFPIFSVMRRSSTDLVFEDIEEGESFLLMFLQNYQYVEVPLMPYAAMRRKFCREDFEILRFTT